MQKSLLTKLLTVLVLTALIGIPLMMIQSTISERLSFHTQAVQTIAADSVQEQTFTGPVLVVPYTEEYEESAMPNQPARKVALRKRFLAYPNTLQMSGVVDTDNRYRGIHKVLVYSSQLSVSGDFVLPVMDDLTKDKPDSKLTLDQPYLTVSINDVRGIRNIPRVEWDGKSIEFEQGSGLSAFRGGLHAPVEVQDWKHGHMVKFAFALGLDGIERLHVVPVAKNNHITLTSGWPHPHFGGRFMPSPKDRRIDAHGFTATWNISSLATNARQQITNLEAAGNAGDTNAIVAGKVDYFSVGFIEPVNIYSQAGRAVKYGLLFVSLTFAAFFLFEVLKQLPIHPVQYLLVGMALALFFLLLVSLSEHIRFEYAYLFASTACILLISFYLAHVLKDWKRGFGFGTGLTALYGTLFSLLRSEDNALVMGSLLLFAVLSIMMIATRKVDWYQIGKSDDNF